MVRSVLIAGGRLTAAWLIGLILIARWAIVTVF